MVVRTRCNSRFVWLVRFVCLAGLSAVACAGQPDSPKSATPSVAEPVAPIEAEIPAKDTDAHPLTGTRWQLVEIQSMDDAQGITKPEDPSKYTLHFVDGESLSMQLNCNRGSGPWSSESTSDGTSGDISGSIAIGPLATTKAMCPPPSLDERIVRDVQWIRGFLVRDGWLSLSLMADGGIYLWEPVGAGS